MMPRAARLALLLALCLPGAAVRGAEADAPPAEPLSHHTYEKTVRVPVRLEYLLYLPEGYAEGNTKWPLVLFLHGAGERGSNLEVLKKHGPPKQVAAGQKFPFILVAPQCPQDEWWDAVKLKPFLEEMIRAYRVDPDRVYVTGLSMGGFGTWALAAACPDRIAAIAPICGGGSVRTAPRFAHLAAWIFHGAKDTTVDVTESEQMFIALKQHGSDARLTIYPDAKHDSWTRTYDNPKFYDWLLAQRLRPMPERPPEPVKVDREPVRLEAEAMTLEGAAAVDLAGASGGKAVRFDAESDAAETTVTLPAGAYDVAVTMFCADGDHDSIVLEAGGREFGLWHSEYGKLAKAARPARFIVAEDGPVTLRFKRREPGVLVDRIEIVPLY